MRHSLLVAAFLLIAGAATAQAQRDGVIRIDVIARPIAAFDTNDPTRTRFGALTFLGGLELTSPSKDFGGISSIRVGPDGTRFLAITDHARWLRGRIVMNGRAPSGIEDAEMAPVLGADGRPLRRRGWYDTEAMADDGAGTVYLGIERVHEVVRFDVGRSGLRARGTPVPMPPGVKSLPSNGGLECVAVPTKGQPLAGSLIAISERGLDADGNIQGFIGGNAPAPGAFAVKRKDEFDITDCALTPRGDLLILERRFSWLRGLAVRIRRLELARVAPDALLDGPELIYADLGQQIDNMEGLSVHRGPDGVLVLTLVSDDNFSPIQRTLLLQFAWEE